MSILIKNEIAENLERYFLNTFSSVMIVEKYHTFENFNESKQCFAVLGIHDISFQAEMSDRFSREESRQHFKESVGADYLWKSLPTYELSAYSNSLDDKAVFFIAFWPNILTKFDSNV